MSTEFSYTVIFEPMREGGYNVVIPALPEIVTYGEDLEEARRMAQDAIKCHLEGLAKDGLQPPEDQELSPITEKLNVALG